MRHIDDRAYAEQCAGCGNRPDYILKTRAFLMLLCEECLEEQMHEMETNEDYEIDILPSN